MFMHRFTAAYTDQELAAAGNYVIGQIGGRQGRITAEQIAEARRSAEKKNGPSKSGS